MVHHGSIVTPFLSGSFLSVAFPNFLAELFQGAAPLPDVVIFASCLNSL